MLGSCCKAVAKIIFLYVMKNSRILLLLLVSTVLCHAGAYAQSDARKVGTLVIDPGHGGSRVPGAVYGGVVEKEVNLKVALLFGKMVEDNLPDVKVYYTRERDTDIGLAERGKFANDKNADLFVSIHCNAAADRNNRIIPSARGSLTLVMGMENDDRNLDVAIRENEAILYEENYETKYAGFDPSSPESYILFSLMAHEHLLESIEFSNILQRHYGNNTTLPITRGVGRQNLMVLWNAAMPAVLTEIGFLTNPEDRSYINSARGQENIARALFNAFSEYKSKREGYSRVVFMDADNDTSTVSMPVAVSETEVSVVPTTPTVHLYPVEGEVPEPVVQAGTAAAPPVERVAAQESANGVVYMVQVIASTRRISMDFADFRSFRSAGISEKRIGNLYKYYVGSTPSYVEAERIKADCRRKFHDAFVVAFRGEEQLKIIDETTGAVDLD